MLRVPLKKPDLIETYRSFAHEDFKLTNFEMETAWSFINCLMVKWLNG